jgi:hypothetical protein
VPRMLHPETPRLPNGSILCHFARVFGLVALGASGCSQSSTDPSCVNIGSGWHACAVTQSAPSTPARPAATDMSVPSDSDAADGGTGPSVVESEPEQGEQAPRPAGAPEEPGPSGVAAHQPVVTSAAGASAAGSSTSAATSGGSSASAGQSGMSSAGAAAAGAPASATPNAGTGAAGATADAGIMSDGGSDAGQTSALGCCHELGECVARESVRPEQRESLTQDTCTDESLLCVPKPLLTESSFVPKACRSTLQAEGRCLPECMTNVASQADRLPSDVCDVHERCAPCYDLVTGDATGACQLGADPGPTESPQVFRDCCGSGERARGLCVPSQYIPADTIMPQADCAAGLACMPRERLLAPSQAVQTCTDALRGLGVCLAQCIGQAISPILTVQASCTAGDVCFPCALVGGESTGVCTDL